MKREGLGIHDGERLIFDGLDIASLPQDLPGYAGEKGEGHACRKDPGDRLL
jgi:hypothetical protein